MFIMENFYSPIPQTLQPLQSNNQSWGKYYPRERHENSKSHHIVFLLSLYPKNMLKELWRITENSEVSKFNLFMGADYRSDHYMTKMIYWPSCSFR